jgi:hypothetical protein
LFHTANITKSGRSYDSARKSLTGRTPMLDSQLLAFFVQMTALQA